MKFLVLLLVPFVVLGVEKPPIFWDDSGYYNSFGTGDTLLTDSIKVTQSANVGSLSSSGYITATEGITSSTYISAPTIYGSLNNNNISQFNNDSGYLTTVDISDDTNLSVDSPLVLTDDTISITSSAFITDTDINTESKLENILTDVTNVFTNNDIIDVSDNTNLAVSAPISITNDTLLFDCVNCLNEDEIEDIYVLNTTDTMTGDLTVGGLQTSGIITATTRVSSGQYCDESGTNCQDVASIDADTLDGNDGVDYILSANLDTESELESQLTDVSNVFTNNDTIDVSDNTNLAVSGVLTLVDDTVGLSASQFISSTDIDTESELEAIITDVSNVFTNNDTITSSNIADVYLFNNADDSTTGILTSGGFTTSEIVTASTRVSTNELCDENGINCISPGNIGLSTSVWTSASNNVYVEGVKVGIGTTAPFFDLVIQGDTNSTHGVLIRNQASSSPLGGVFVGATENSQPKIVGLEPGQILEISNLTTGSIEFRQNLESSNDVLAKFDKDQIFLSSNVGVGTTSPQSELEVSGDISSSGLLVSGTVTATTGVSSAEYCDENGTNCADISGVLISADLDSESELESQLSDVTNVFTNNDTITSSNISDVYLFNNANDTTSGVLTAAGFSTSGIVTASTRVSTAELCDENGENCSAPTDYLLSGSIWTSSTPNVYVDTASHNVGIGTSSTEGRLHVWDGEVGAPTTLFGFKPMLFLENNNDFVSGINILSGDASISVIGFGDSTDSFAFGAVYNHIDDTFSFSSGVSNTFLQNSAGTTTIIGSEGVSHALLISNAGNVSEGLGSQINFVEHAGYPGSSWKIGTFEDDLFIGKNGNGQSETMYLTSGLNVGIGVSAPTAKLDVSGDVSATFFGSNGEIRTTHDSVAGLKTYGPNVNGTNSASIASYLDNTSAGGFDNYTDIVARGGGGGSQIRLLNQRSSSSEPEEAMRIDFNGNLGIGTTDPSTKLAVSGDISNSGDVYTSDVFITERISHDTDSDTYIEFDGSDGVNVYAGNTKAAVFSNANGVVLDPDDSGIDFRIGSPGATDPRLLVDGSGGVAINKNSAGFDLGVYEPNAGDATIGVVAEDASSTSDAYVLLRTQSTGGDPHLRFNVDGSDTWYVGIDNSADSKLRFSYNTSTFISSDFVIDGENERVGVGQSNPKKMLHLGDTSADTPTIRFDGSSLGNEDDPFSGMEFMNNSSSNDGPQVGARIMALAGTNLGHGTKLSFEVSDGLTGSENASPTQAMIIDESGNIGIGISDPTYSLDISGTNMAHRAEYPTFDFIGTNSGSSKSYRITEASGLFIFKNITDNDSTFQFLNNDNSVLMEIRGGNVGVGLDNATTKLEVSGAVSASGNANFTGSGSKLIMRSPDGSCSSCGPDNSDNWTCSSVACP